MTSSIAAGNVQYNYAQIEGIWIQAGGASGAAPIAAAIAMAESGGNTTATDNDSNGSVDRGLWQINSVHGAQSTYDVMGNARAAIAISNNGTNWSAWTTYTSGAYQQYLQVNVPPDTSAPINATNAAVNQNTATLTGDNLALSLPGGLWDPANWFLEPLGAVGGAASGAAGAVSSTLIKYFLQGLVITIINPMLQIIAGIMGITAGAAMVIVGIWITVRNTEVGQSAERTAGTAAQAGMLAFGPEAAAATRYVGASGAATTVTQRRRPAGAVRVGGQRVQYRPAQVTTSVQREPELAPPPSTRQALRNEAGEYTRSGDSRQRYPTTSSTHRTYRGPGGAGGRGGSSGR